MERAMSDEMKRELLDKGLAQFAKVTEELGSDDPDMEVIRKAVLAGLTVLEPVGFTLTPPQKRRNPDDVTMISRGVPPKKEPTEATS